MSSGWRVATRFPSEYKCRYGWNIISVGWRVMVNLYPPATGEEGVRGLGWGGLDGILVDVCVYDTGGRMVLFAIVVSVQMKERTTKSQEMMGVIYTSRFG